jgi:hypothetical protein
MTEKLYDEKTVGRLIDYLVKENVISGKVVKNYLIKDTLPKAWSKLISEPDELLVELLAEATEKLCGHKPDNSTVENFISVNLSKIETSYRLEEKTKAIPGNQSRHLILKNKI